MLFLLGCSTNPESESLSEDGLKLVKYGSIVLSGGTQTRSYSGTTQSASESRLSFRTSGLLIQLKTDVGQRVRKGQLLAVVDQTETQLNYEKAVATEQSARIQLETTKANLDRVKQLYLANSASLSDYENEKNSYASALSNHESAKKSLNLQASQFAYGRIVAPTDGVISEVNVELNEFVQAGSTIFVFNTEDSEIEANIGVPEKQITKIKEGQTVDVSVGELQLKGTVTGVSYSTSGSSTFPVIVTLEANEDLRPGMPCKVSFEFEYETGEPRLIAPIKSISENPEGNFAYTLIEQDNGTYYTVEKRTIELGPINDEGFIVLEGLQEGDLVATAGLRSIIDGMKVKLLHE